MELFAILENRKSKKVLPCPPPPLLIYNKSGSRSPLSFCHQRRWPSTFFRLSGISNSKFSLLTLEETVWQIVDMMLFYIKLNWIIFLLYFHYSSKYFFCWFSHTSLSVMCFEHTGNICRLWDKLPQEKDWEGESRARKSRWLWKWKETVFLCS